MLGNIAIFILDQVLTPFIFLVMFNSAVVLIQYEYRGLHYASTKYIITAIYAACG